MSGYLQRLAARAMGMARPMRTVAATAFAEMPTLREETALVTAEQLISAGSMAVGAPMAVQAPEVQGREVGAPIEAQATTRTAPGGRFAMPTELPAGSIQPASLVEGGRGSPALDSTISESVRARGENVASGDHHATADRQTPATLLPLAASEMVSRTGAHAPASESPRPAPQVSDAPVTAGIRPIVSPQPLLQPLIGSHVRVNGPHGGQWRGAGGSATDAPGGRVEETTEVHVNIGRIEVTAVHETPAAKPAPRRRNTPMSLDQYVAHRQGGRS
jgi:hypothetical protein